MDNIDTINYASRLELAGSKLLAETIAGALNKSRWVNSSLKIRLCIMFMQKMLENKLEKSENIALIRKIRKRPIHFTVRLLKRYPDRGLHILSQVIMDELKGNQKFKLEQLAEFHSALLDLLFPPKNQPKPGD